MKKAVAILTLLMVFVTLGIFFASCHDNAPQLSYKAQLQKDTTIIAQYLATNNIKAKRDTSGLYYVVNSLGTGVKPTLTSTVVVQLVGKFLSNGQTFDVDTIPITSTVSSWQPNCFLYGFQLVPKGSKFTLYIPSGLGFGSTGSYDGKVPPNTNLIYNVTSIDNDAQLVKDVAAIDFYISSNLIPNVINDPSGLRYVIVTPGTGGPVPTLTNNVSVTYTGTFLNATKPFTSIPNETTYSMTQIIQGFQIGLPHIAPPDGHIVLYIPSGLGYGAGGSLDGSIPRNQNLIFDVHLLFVD